MVLSAYELQRNETMAQNAAKLVELGIGTAKASLAAISTSELAARPRRRSPAKKSPPARPQPQRATRGLVSRLHAGATEEELTALLAAEPDVGSPTKAEERRTHFEWADHGADKKEPITAEERATLVVPADWLDGFHAYFELEDSVQNVQNVMKVVRKLVSGDGVTSGSRTL